MNNNSQCSCLTPPLDYNAFEAADDLKHFGQDSRGGSITIERCKLCGRIWLNYFIEYESFTSSGRWCRAPVVMKDLATLTDENVLSHIANQPMYLYGGSFFNGIVCVGTSPFAPEHWLRPR